RAGIEGGVSENCGAIRMDSVMTAAARALAAGDPLGALTRVALRNDAPGLALRGIAMAQLGDFARAKELLHRAARGFSAKEVVARARCVVAEAEIALASRDLGLPESTRRGTGDARKAQRPGECRARAVPSGAASCSDWARGRRGAHACRCRSDALSTCAENRARTGDRGNRDAAYSGQRGTCSARSGRISGATDRHPGADSRG